MFDALSKIKRNVIVPAARFSVCVVKAFTATVNVIDLLTPITAVAVSELPDELKKGTPAAIGMVLTGTVIFTSVAYIKYLQMFPSNSNRKEETTQLLLSNDSEASDTTQPQIVSQKPHSMTNLQFIKSIFYTYVASPIYILTDIVLQMRSFDNFLNYFGLSKPIYLLIGTPINSAFYPAILLQDIRLVAKSSKYARPWLAKLGGKLEQFQETSHGLRLEVAATFYRTGVAKTGLFLLFDKHQNLKGLIIAEMLNLLSLANRSTNNRTQFKRNNHLTDCRIAETVAKTSATLPSYCVEDSGLQTNVLGNSLKLNDDTATGVFAFVFAAEMVSYAEKSYESNKDLTWKNVKSSFIKCLPNTLFCPSKACVERSGRNDIIPSASPLFN